MTTAIPSGHCGSHGYHGRTACPKCVTSAIPPALLPADSRPDHAAAPPAWRDPGYLTGGKLALEASMELAEQGDLLGAAMHARLAADQFVLEACDDFAHAVLTLVKHGATRAALVEQLDEVLRGG